MGQNKNEAEILNWQNNKTKIERELEKWKTRDLALFEIVDSAAERWYALVEQGITTPAPLHEL